MISLLFYYANFESSSIINSVPYEFIISVSAIFIALLALSVTIWQGILIRKHNRLSVKPILNIDYNFSAHIGDIGIYLINKGIGPAVIIDYKVFVDDILLECDYTEIWHKAAPLLRINEPWVTSHFLEPGEGINAGDKLGILIIKKESMDPAKLLKFISSVKRLMIKIEYESIYHEKNNVMSEGKYIKP